MGYKTTGLVLGKFLPLHKGHELLLTFACHFVSKLYIVVDHVLDAPIPGELRCQWIRDMFPQAEVYYIPSSLPQHPEEHPDFWSIWKNNLLALLPQKPDYLFASEAYGVPLASVIGATFIPFDLQRQIVPVSGTVIRQSPLRYWDYLSSGAKKHYLKRICIVGPESTGKTTLATSLAAHYNTCWVPEYARLFIESTQEIKQDDMLHIAAGQIALEKAMVPMANKFLFCDTDPLCSILWSHYLFGACSEEIVRLATQHTYDLYLLMYPDLEWKDDPVRYLPGKGLDFFNHCVELLTSYQRPFVIVKGTNTARLQCAIHHVEAFLQCLE